MREKDIMAIANNDIVLTVERHLILPSNSSFILLLLAFIITVLIILIIIIIIIIIIIVKIMKESHKPKDGKTSQTLITVINLKFPT